jgi:hypothetical protein
MDPFSQLRRSYDTELLILRSLFALDADTNLPISTNFIVTTDGIGGLVWMDPFQNLSTAGPGVGYLPSTIFDLTTNLSTVSSLVSTINFQYQAGLSSLSSVLGLSYISSGIYDPQLTSTVAGLGNSGYVSSSQLFSTVSSLGSLGYISSSQLLSTVAGLGSGGYISTTQLASTVGGLASIGFVSSSQLISSISSLGSLGYISSSQLRSTVAGLGSVGYISSSQLISSISSLGSLGYVSSSQLISTISSLGSLGYVSTSQLTSTMNWLLAPSNYVSTGALISTTNALSSLVNATFYIDNAGNITINNGNVSFSSAGDIVYLSSFVFSSITYSGTNGLTTAQTYDGSPARSMIFSSASIRLDRFSSFITARSRLYLDLYPSFVFSGIYQGASGYLMTEMSTFLKYGATNLTSYMANNWVYGTNTSNSFGNLYSQPIKLQVEGSAILNNYANPYTLCHNLVSSLTFDTTNGFKTCNVDVRIGSTNSLFLTIQNLP